MTRAVGLGRRQRGEDGQGPVSTDVATATARKTRAEWHPDALHFAGWLGIPASAREDVVHTALVRVLPHASSLAKPSSLKSYLFTTVRNLWWNEQTRRGSGATSVGLDELEIAEPALGPDELLVQQGDYATARAAFEALAPAHREVIQLRYIDALDYRDVARVLGVNQATARQRLRRARQQLIRTYALVDVRCRSVQSTKPHPSSTFPRERNLK
jgi:RNA polymerase sigma-70 factor (ECF subfamily)